MVTVNFICNNDAGDVGTVLPHFSVPVFEVCVGDFPGDVEAEDCSLGPEVIGGMEGLETFLPSSVPDVFR